MSSFSKRYSRFDHFSLTCFKSEVQGKKHGFLAGNTAYYIGGQFGLWDLWENETIGLTHPFKNDLRSRGTGITSYGLTGTGNDFYGWSFHKDTRVAYGTVIIDRQVRFLTA